jgi:diguanylate cyclase (GGDEF)-like protein
MTLVSVLNFVLMTLVLALYAWIGEVPWSSVWWFGGAGIGHSAAVALAIHRGWNLRFRDKDLMVPQFYASVAVMLGGLVLTPQLSVLFLVGLLVIYSFGMMRFGPRQFNAAWVLVGVSTATALFAVRGRLGQMAPTDRSVAILALFIFMVLRQLTVFGTGVTALRNRLSEKNRQLAESLNRIEQMARHDDLTGALNRHAFMEAMSDERTRTLRTGQPFAVALLDIDHFKSVNDRFGHLSGDAVLKAFCELVRVTLRSTDRLGRFGGEEFILLLVLVEGGDAARIAAERIRNAIEEYDWGQVVPGLSITTSLGLAVFERADTIETMIARADRALYAAKDAGRNRTEVG